MTDKEILSNLHRLPFVAVSEVNTFFPDYAQTFIMIPKKAIGKSDNGTERLPIEIKKFSELKQDDNNVTYVKKGITFIEPKNPENQMKTYIKKHGINPHEL